MDIFNHSRRCVNLIYFCVFLNYCGLNIRFSVTYEVFIYLYTYYLIGKQIYSWYLIEIFLLRIKYVPHPPYLYYENYELWHLIEHYCTVGRSDIHFSNVFQQGIHTLIQTKHFFTRTCSLSKKSTFTYSEYMWKSKVVEKTQKHRHKIKSNGGIGLKFVFFFVIE